MTIFKPAFAWAVALLIPLYYLLAYTPQGMDTTDFGYFYGYAWRILQGETPYRDFTYIKPAFPLFWHAFWMWLTPEKWQVLAGKAGFLTTVLAASWLGSLYLYDIFRLNIPLPLMATVAFIFSIHSFPHMPWHTPDGVLFSSAALYCAASSLPVLSALFSICALLCKQSFLFVPMAILLFIYFYTSGKQALMYLFSCAIFLFLAAIWVYNVGAWENFRIMTTGQLDIREALDAGILIYLRQNWVIPIIAFLPWIISALIRKRLPAFLSPWYIYFPLLTVWVTIQVFTERQWVGFGMSWPTLFVLTGCLIILFPGKFLLQHIRKPDLRHPELACSIALGAALCVAWSTAISGGYKIPAFFAVPGLFSVFIFQDWLRLSVKPLAWLALFCGLIMFGCAYQYPYVFPVRPLKASDFTEDAGKIYKKATGVKVDREMLARLEELKELRAKYGPNYKTLPGFSMAYYLNDDKPVYGSDWLIDWEINGQIDKFYQDLLDKKITVFMERDQMDTKQADGYVRAGYGVPRLVRKNWRIVEETPHFVVFQPPLEGKERLRKR